MEPRLEGDGPNLATSASVNILDMDPSKLQSSPEQSETNKADEDGLADTAREPQLNPVQEEPAQEDGGGAEKEEGGTQPEGTAGDAGTAGETNPGE